MSKIESGVRLPFTTNFNSSSVNSGYGARTLNTANQNILNGINLYAVECLLSSTRPPSATTTLKGTARKSVGTTRKFF